MTLAALVLLLAVPQSGPVPQTGDAQKAATSAVSTDTSSADDSSAKPASATASASVSDTPVVPAATNESLSASNLLPSMPEPKSAPSAAAGVPAAFPVAPVKAPVVVYSETPAQRKVWYTLAIVGHSAAASVWQGQEVHERSNGCPGQTGWRMERSVDSRNST